ncbi:MAG: high frequency lysogenization protein HflD [Gammaproteobacteria bacterium]|nr:high frequency lysogenization protein HflD [Gammaproteobacteria bacterium]
MKSRENQVIALAGIFQSAILIEQLAHKGEINQAAFDCCIDSLFIFESNSVLDIYGDLAGLNRGLQALVEYLSGRNNQSGKSVAYYIMSMMKLSNNLMQQQDLASQLQQDLKNIQRHSIDFEMSRNSIINKIDGLYQRSISQQQPRIIVRGDQDILSNTDNAAKVRALIFSGIRSAVLWNQLGGSKWKLIFLRKKYVDCAKRFLSNI